jgi:dihydroorotate dehydrogenase
MVSIGVFLGKFKITRFITKLTFGYSNKMLEQEILGIKFKNPVGLSAGFDKNAQLTQILPSVGFGFEEVGSITGEQCKGNEGTRLWRLKNSKSLLVYYGLKNDGADVISKRLKDKNFRIPIGISIAKTNSPETCETETGIADYLKAYKAFENIGAYFTVNISCPNTFGGQPFTDPEKLEKLLVEIKKLPKSKPIFVKISPDLPNEQIDQIIKVVDKSNIDGFIISNLTKNRDNKNIKDKLPSDHGGMSGKIVEDLANDLISYVYHKTEGRYLIIGSGGVFTAEDAYKKIKLGASLVQMITGMIFEGPQVISEINRGLVKLLKKDGYKNISEAVGKTI